MGSYSVGLSFSPGTGPGNNTATFIHAPDIFPTSTNYKLLCSMSYQTDYTIGSNIISISIQIIMKNQTHIQGSLYTDYVQSFSSNLIRIQVFVIDELSSAFPHILPSILRINGISLVSTTYSSFVVVSSFNSTSLNLSKTLRIYSFLVGFVIQSTNSNFNLKTNSQIINSTHIKVDIFSNVNLPSVTRVRIDTVVVDQTQLTINDMWLLDFQTITCPLDSPSFTYAYPSGIQNMFTGLSQFYLQNKAVFKFTLTQNAADIIITFYPTYSFSRIVFSNLNFVKRQCPGGYPYFNKTSELCFNTQCLQKQYRVVSPDQCLPCFYSCKTCTNSVTCTTCDSVVDFRYLDVNSSLCLPMNSYYDDGTNNSVCQPCNSPCSNCIGDADNCTSCINMLFYVDFASMKCILCSSSISSCLQCSNSFTCTLSCQYTCSTCDNSVNCTSCDSSIDFRQMDPNTSLCIPMNRYYDDGTYNSVCQPCLYFCKTCQNSVNCTTCDSVVDFRYLDVNSSLCLPMNGFYDNGTNNSVCQLCNSPCSNCIGDADNCTSCINMLFYVDYALMKCILCSSSIVKCLECSNSLTCTLSCQYTCLTCDNGANCTSCDSLTDFRQMDPNTSLCVPMNAYYDDGTNNSVCQLCLQPCQNCEYAANKCTSCVNQTYYLDVNSSSCIMCSMLIIGCQACDQNQSQVLCLVCDIGSGFILTNQSDCQCSNDSFLNSANQSCFLCANFIQYCEECQSQTQCTLCSSYFFSVNMTANSTNSTICQQICGDGVLYNLECDDGNLANGDGCSSTCMIEPFFTCSGGSPTSMSICTYNGNVKIITVSFLKDQTQNRFYLIFKVQTDFNISGIDLNLLFVPNFPYQSIQTVYDYSKGQYMCSIDYNVSLNFYNNLELTFRLPIYANFSITQDYRITLNSQTDNNLALKVYSSGMYSHLKILTKSSQILVYLYTAVCILAWIAGQQLYSLEMLFIVQYAYLGLLTIEKLQFSMICLKQFGFTFGIFDQNDLMKNSNEFQIDPSNKLPIRVKSLGFSQSLLQNINFSFLVIILMIFVGLLIYLIGLKLDLIKWKTEGKKMFFWWVLYWIILIQIPTMVSIVIGLDKLSQQIFEVEIGISAFYLIMLLCVCIYLPICKKTSTLQVKTQDAHRNKGKKEQTQQNQAQTNQIQEKTYTFANKIQVYFVQQSNEKQVPYFFYSIFYSLVIVYRVLIVCSVIFLSDSVGSNVICVFLDIMMLIYISVIRPYEQNFRPIFNSSTILVISIFYIYQKISGYEFETNYASFQAVIGIIAILYLTLIINSFFILRQIKQKIKGCFDSQEKQMNQKIKNEANATNDEIMNDNEYRKNLQIQENVENLNNKQKNIQGLTQNKMIYQTIYVKKREILENSYNRFLHQSGESGQSLQALEIDQIDYNKNEQADINALPPYLHRQDNYEDQIQQNQANYQKQIQSEEKIKIYNTDKSKNQSIVSNQIKAPPPYLYFQDNQEVQIRFNNPSHFQTVAKPEIRTDPLKIKFQENQSRNSHYQDNRFIHQNEGEYSKNQSNESADINKINTPQSDLHLQEYSEDQTKLNNPSHFQTVAKPKIRTDPLQIKFQENQSRNSHYQDNRFIHQQKGEQSKNQSNESADINKINPPQSDLHLQEYSEDQTKLNNPSHFQTVAKPKIRTDPLKIKFQENQSRNSHYQDNRFIHQNEGEYSKKQSNESADINKINTPQLDLHPQEDNKGQINLNQEDNQKEILSGQKIQILNVMINQNKNEQVSDNKLNEHPPSFHHQDNNKNYEGQSKQNKTNYFQKAQKIKADLLKIKLQENYQQNSQKIHKRKKKNRLEIQKREQKNDE